MPTPRTTRRGEPWQSEELKLLGQISDSEFARRFRRSFTEITAMCKAQRIHLSAPPKRWTTREIALLGRFNDREVARRLRRPWITVRRHRINLHIPSIRPLPKTRLWTRSEEKLLGTMSDEQLARRLHRSIHGVPIGTQRLRLERPPGSKVVLCLHPSGHYSVLAAAGSGYPNVSDGPTLGHPGGGLSNIFKTQVGFRLEAGWT